MGLFASALPALAMLSLIAQPAMPAAGGITLTVDFCAPDGTRRQVHLPIPTEGQDQSPSCAKPCHVCCPRKRPMGDENGDGGDV